MDFSGLNSRSDSRVLRDEGMETLKESLMWEIPISPLKHVHALPPCSLAPFTHIREKDEKIFTSTRKIQETASDWLNSFFGFCYVTIRNI